MSSWVRYSIAVYVGLLLAGMFDSVGAYWASEFEHSSAAASSRPRLVRRALASRPVVSDDSTRSIASGPAATVPAKSADAQPDCPTDGPPD